MASGPLASTVMVWYHFSCVKSHLHGEPVSQISALTPDSIVLYWAVLSFKNIGLRLCLTRFTPSFHSAMTPLADRASYLSLWALLAAGSPHLHPADLDEELRRGFHAPKIPPKRRAGMYWALFSATETNLACMPWFSGYWASFMTRSGKKQIPLKTFQQSRALQLKRFGNSLDSATPFWLSSGLKTYLLSCYSATKPLWMGQGRQHGLSPKEKDQGTS